MRFILFNIKTIVHSDAFLFCCFFSVGLLGYWVFFNSETAPASLKGDYSVYFNDKSNRIIVYSRKSCKYCIKLEAYFVSNHIDYLEKDIGESDFARAEYEQLGGYGTPLVLFRDELIIGFRKELILNKLQNADTNPKLSLSTHTVSPR
ncbi:glutaredoxin [Shewanella denitrificans OS217]|uniref:Glutaredoxin n=1 Tax=Shewanella denitrificans (strain OS217 / ATCC BAA-1090 / DSM 15013) TaxID=318161 RepID=Q12NV8_SHEDO|nr:glutaredoxin [Shewanella denitrificans OS217]